MNLIITKKVVATFTSVATVAMLTAGAFLPMAAGAYTAYSNEQRLTVANGQAFGDFISMSADGSRAVIADSNENNRQGAVYVFVRNGTTWAQEQRLVAADGAGNDRFGAAVAMSGDGTQIIVGAPDHNLCRGAAYVFTRPSSGTTWTQTQKLLASDGQPAPDFYCNGDKFGTGVAVSSDGSLALIGAAGDDTSAGSAYAFTRSGAVWTESQKLTASPRQNYAQFGASTALAADGSRGFVGATNYDSNGAAYVFSRSGTIWTQEGTPLIGDPANYTPSVFGAFLAASADGSRLAVGAPNDNGYQGAAYVFSRSSTTWTREQKLPTPVEYGRLGQSVAMNGAGTLLVVGRDTFDGDRGGAYVYERSNTTWTQQQELFAFSCTDCMSFGHGAAMAADGSRVILGAIGDDQHAGAAYVFTTPSQTPKPSNEPKLCDPKPGKICICHYPDGNPANVQILEVSVNALKGHLKTYPEDELYEQQTNSCPSVVASAGSTSATSILTLAAAALAAGLGIGLYARRRA